MAFRKITLYRADSGLPDLVLDRSVDGGNWCKRSDAGFATITGRSIPGIPIVGNSSKDYFIWQVATLLTSQQWTIFEELKRLQRVKYNALEDGAIVLKDEYNYVTQSETALNSREIISGSTVNTGVGIIIKSFCTFPVFLEVGEEHLPFDGDRDWCPLTFSMQELP